MSDNLSAELAASRAIAERCWFQIRTVGGIGMRQELLNDRSSAADMLREMRRNHLLVRPELTPGVERALQKACANLRLPRHIVLAFIKSDGQLRASCHHGTNRALLFLSSGLVQNCSEEELAFVIGHEIGHFILPEAHLLANEETSEGLMHYRACEFTMDRIGLVACGETKPACNAILKLLSGLAEPHLRLDISAAMQESREVYDGTLVRWEAQQTHPPLLMRLRALLQFSTTDACLGAWGKEGGSPVQQANIDLVQRMNENVDGAVRQQTDEALRMVKAWFHCLCRSRGEPCGLDRLNQADPRIDAALLDKAWASLGGLSNQEVGEHATKRLKSALEKAAGHTPERTLQLARTLLGDDFEDFLS